jgi:hypothetical protein
MKTLTKIIMMNRELSTEGVDKAQHLLFYFKGNTDAIFCHCMEVLDLIYEINKGKPFEEIQKACGSLSGCNVLCH